MDLDPNTEHPDFLDDAKSSVSFRVKTSDIGFAKALAGRFGVRTSEVLRFILALGLQRLAVFRDTDAQGRDLGEFLADSGLELVEHFDLDQGKLKKIVNQDNPAGSQIDDLLLELLVLLSRSPESAHDLIEAQLPELVEDGNRDRHVLARRLFGAARERG